MMIPMSTAGTRAIQQEEYPLCNLKSCIYKGQKDS
jgi:hypothetical protein